VEKVALVGWYFHFFFKLLDEKMMYFKYFRKVFGAEIFILVITYLKL